MADEIWATVTISTDVGFGSNPSPPQNRDIQVKHLNFPFQFGPDLHAKSVEQDSDEDIMGCVESIVRTNVGQRIEVPDYGMPDQTFAEGGPDETVVERSIEAWEDRAVIDAIVEKDVTEEGKYHLTIDVEPGGGSL